MLSPLGVSMPADKNAQEKYETGVFDDVSLANRKSYPEELFEVCGYKFNGEKYIIDKPEERIFPGLDFSRPLIGMNTGAGIRWTSRLWSTGHWAELAKKLHAKGYNVLLLGGPDEDRAEQRNTKSFWRNSSISRIFSSENFYLASE